MSELFRLLALYYACDNTAAMRTLTASEVAACMQHYTAIKTHFAANARDDRNAGYQRFKIWERENGDLVVRLRAGRYL